MSDLDLLSRVSSAFDPVKLQTETYAIRVKIAQHIETLQATQEKSKILTIPNHVQGYRKKYLEASQANAVAKAELALLHEQTRNQSTNVEDPSSSTSLGSHLEVLKLRRQHQHYSILSHYASEAETVASDHQIYNTDPVVDPNTSRRPQEQTEEIHDLTAELQALTRNLEVAFLQINHKVQQERHLLTKLKAQASSKRIPPPSNEAKLHALTTTRAELTSWIEASLAQCDEEQQQQLEQDPSLVAASSSLSSPPPDPGRHYELYIEARKRLLTAVSSTSQPQSQPQIQHRPPPSLITAPSLPTTTTTTIRPIPIPNPTPSLLQIQSSRLQTLSLLKSLDQHKTHLSSVLSSSTSDLEAALSRLRDESHLLGSYPILSRPRLQSQLRRGIQDRDRDRDRDQVGNKDGFEDRDGDGDQRPTLRSELDEIKHLLREWEFAKEAAATSVGAVVDKQRREGEGMVDRTFDAVETMVEQDRVWTRFSS